MAMTLNDWGALGAQRMKGHPGNVQICNDGEASVPKDILLYNALLEGP